MRRGTGGGNSGGCNREGYKHGFSLPQGHSQRQVHRHLPQSAAPGGITPEVVDDKCLEVVGRLVAKIAD